MNKLQHAQLSEVIKNSQESLLMLSELHVAVANELKSKFDALVESGFAPEQAIALIVGRAI